MPGHGCDVLALGEARLAHPSTASDLELAAARLNDFQVLGLNLATLEFVGSEFVDRIPIFLFWSKFLPLLEASCLTVEREFTSENAGFDLELAQLGVSFVPSYGSWHLLIEREVQCLDNDKVEARSQEGVLSLGGKKSDPPNKESRFENVVSVEALRSRYFSDRLEDA